MTYLKELLDLQETEKQRLKDLIKATHPIIRIIRLYSYRNVLIESENFSVDMYENSTYTEENISMNCSNQMLAIPTEEEAIEKIKALHAEQAEFIKAMHYVQALLTTPVELKDA